MSNRSIQVSTSKISCFKQCRKKYYFKYIEKIEVPRKQELEDGSNYHEQVENILQNKEYVSTPMSEAFKRYIMPQLPIMAKVEQEFNLKIGYGVELVGKIDAFTIDGIPVEHKTTKNSIDEKYVYRLNFDEQTSTYLLATSLMTDKLATKLIYTSVQKPTIRQKQNESIEEYTARCFEWYDETKARTFTVVRNYNEINSWRDEIIKIAKEIKQCKNFYRCPFYCSIVGCEYASQCLDYSGDIL